MAKFKTLSICQKIFYGIKLIHANVQCVYIVFTKYQMDSVKVLVGVDFLAHILSSTIQNYKVTLIELAPSLYVSIIRYVFPDIKVFEKFDEFQLLSFQDIKEKPKCYGRTDRRTDNVKIEYLPPPTHTQT